MNLPSNSKIHSQRCASRRGCLILVVRNVISSYRLQSKFDLKVRNLSGGKGDVAVALKITRIVAKMAQKIAALKMLATTRVLLRNTCHPRHTSVATQISRTFSTAPELVEETHSSTFQYATIGDIMRKKGASDDGSWLWCTQADTVYDAVKSMTSHNVGALLVLKSDGSGAIAGIITERDYLRKIIVQGRSSKTTNVGDIMTEENKLITVTPDTRVLTAMDLMTQNRIRHIPVCEDRKMKGMVSIGDVVRAVVEEHKMEVNRLNDYIKGSY